MVTFPETPSYTGQFKPARFEADIADLEIEGRLPTDIDGAFYRVQPDPQFPPKLGNDIAFNGDGAVSMFRFKNGKVNFKHRWVHTDKFELERQAGKALFGAYRNPLTDDSSVKGRYRGTANTNVLTHAGRLYALKEDSPPVLMDPNTLETKGYYHFDGKLSSETFTAHPKIDPRTGDMIAFGYAAKGILTRDIAYFEIAADGSFRRDVWFELPYYCMMHDFGVTADYAIFHVVPCTSNWDRLKAGLPHFGFDTTKDIYVGVLPRAGDAKDIRWFRGPNLFASHVMNCFNDGSKIYFDIPVAAGNMFPFFPDIHGAAFDPQKAQAHLTRWTINMDSTGSEIESYVRLWDKSGEFPRIDDRYAMSPYRHGYMLLSDLTKPVGDETRRSASGMLFNCLGHYDHSTGTAKTWWTGPTSSLQEPCFIPKSQNAPEGVGYITAIANLHDTGLSDLLLFDAEHIDEGPIATIKLPLRLRPGLHGNWTPGHQLNSRPSSSYRETQS
jgi:carotenoid cleavage dioxygenase